MQFRLNEAALRKQFLRKSRELHPDFNIDSDTENDAQEAVLEKATYNNTAYETLLDEDKRLHYILSEKGLIGNSNNANNKGDSNKTALPQFFLVEMMDINETLMDLELEGEDSPEVQILKVKLEAETKEMEQNLYHSVESLLQTENAENLSDENWHDLKIFYLKRQYLRRILNNS